MLELMKKQEEKLKRMHKEPLLVKLDLSRKFLRDVLCSRKSALGVGTMKPSTIMNVLKGKLCLGVVRRDRVMNQAVTLQEEYLQIEAG